MYIESLKRKSRRRLTWAARHAADFCLKRNPKTPHLPVYWSYSDNFGEWITSQILRSMGIYAEYTCVPDSKLVSTGSILEQLPADYKGIILGSGFIHETSRVAFDQADVWAVRGNLTAERISSVRTKAAALGDPGLLAGNIGIKRLEKKYRLGIIPHYSDYHLVFSGALRNLRQNNPGEVNIIDVQQSPVTVIRQIMMCETVLSSSLHGLIVADALGIPNQWIEFSTLVGGHFKFHDYYSSLGIFCAPEVNISGKENTADLISLANLKPIEAVSQRKDELLKLFKRISTMTVNGELG